MKELRRNMRLIAWGVVALFLGLSAWFAWTAFTQGDIWASDVHNTRLASANALRGNITDRDGALLATSAEDGRRRYLENDAARRALSQTVGDTRGMSGTGVESFYAAPLLDISGSLLDRMSELFSGVRRTGSSVQLTIDAPLQAYIAAQFPGGYDGAVCVTNWKTGEILAMVSMPGYDPYDVTENREDRVPDTAYLNRCLQGLYTPGSVFKIVTLAAAFTNDPGVIRQPFTCSGLWEYEGGRINCIGNTAHGAVSLETAFKRSCNVTFGKLAYQLGLDRLRAMAERFGFNENFKFGDFVVYNSAFPTRANTSGLVWSGIGQGEVLVTPLHMALVAGAVANGGTMMKPWLVRQITTALGNTTTTGAPAAYREVLDSRVAAKIAEYMRKAVEDGTATRARVKGLAVCGKTGTAEISDDKTVETNAWFTGFIDDKSHPYAIAVVIEGGGAGARMPSELAAKALKKTVELVG